MPYFSSLQQFLDTVTARLTKPKRGVGGSEGVLATDVLEALKDTGKYTDDMRVVAQNVLSTFNAVYDPALNAASQAAASAAAAQALVLGVSTARPSIRPSLLLDFANARAVDPRISFTRNSIGTYFDAQGVMRAAQANQPRITFDPVTGRCLGLLTEELRTNTLTWSSDYSNAYWAKTGSTTITAQGLSLNGTVGKKITEGNTTDLHRIITGGLTIVSGTTYTVSGYIQAAGRAFAVIRLNFASAVFVNVVLNLTTGQVYRAPAGYTCTMRAGPNGYYRFTIVVVAGNTTVALAVGPANEAVNDDMAYSYLGNGVSGILVDGLQIEVGDFATSYIPTTTAAVTRGTDTLIYPTSSDWFNAQEGTIFVEFTRAAIAPGASVVAFALDTNNQIRITSGVATPAQLRLDVISGEVAQSIIQLTTTSVANTVYRIAARWKAGAFAASLNGGALITTSSGSVPQGLTQLALSGGNLFRPRVAYYPRAIGDSEVQSLAGTGLLSGTSPNQLPTAGDLGSAAFESLPSLLMRPNRQEFQVEGTGSSRTITIRRPYDFTFVLVDATGSTITAQPSATCAANTNYSLTFNAPAGTLLTYAITPIFYA